VALADIEQALDPGVPWRTCAVCHYLSEKDEVWGARMRRMLANRGIKFRDIASELLKDPDEPNISTDALSRHAQAGCSARELLRPTGKPIA
jgi:hypothetical protein